MTSNLDERRSIAIKADQCFSKTRLRDEFRMKPANGVEPVKWFKNEFGKSYGIYRIAECVPMRPKRDATDKQKSAGVRLGILSKLRSDEGRKATIAYELLQRNPLFLDTETTGLGPTAEAIEIGLVDAKEEIIYTVYLKPTIAIEAGATAVHGLQQSDVSQAPSWPQIVSQLREAIGTRPLIIFNAPFDIRILKQTAAAHGDPATWLDELEVHCAMKLAAGYFGATNRYGGISLFDAAYKAGVEWIDKAHSASEDARVTAAVINHIADYYEELQSRLALLNDLGKV